MTFNDDAQLDTSRIGSGGGGGGRGGMVIGGGGGILGILALILYMPVSYTHLDVYKRQLQELTTRPRRLRQGDQVEIVLAPEVLDAVGQEQDPLRLQGRDRALVVADQDHRAGEGPQRR